MATTKQLLERMVQKVASNAVNLMGTSGSIITLTPTANPPKVYEKVTAPCDGYAYLEVRSASTNIRARLSALTDSNADGIASSCTQIAGLGLVTCFVPVKKGGIFNYFWTAAAADVNLRFVKSIGGGYSLIKAVLRSGGAVWLRLKNCLKKRLTQESGKHCRKARQSQSLSRLCLMVRQRGKTSHRMCHRLMDGLRTTLQALRVPFCDKVVIGQKEQTLRITKSKERFSLFGKESRQSSFAVIEKALQAVALHFTSVPACRNSLALEGGL